MPELKKNPLPAQWDRVAMVTLAGLILFNKRRGEEPAKLQVKAFLCRPSWEDGNEEILKTFTKFELALMKRYVTLS